MGGQQPPCCALLRSWLDPHLLDRARRLQEALCRTRFSRPAREGAATQCRPQPDTAAYSKQSWSGRQRLVTTPACGTHRNKLWSERRWAWRGECRGQAPACPEGASERARQPIPHHHLKPPLPRPPPPPPPLPQPGVRRLPAALAASHPVPHRRAGLSAHAAGGCAAGPGRRCGRAGEALSSVPQRALQACLPLISPPLCVCLGYVQCTSPRC